MVQEKGSQGAFDLPRLLTGRGLGQSRVRLAPAEAAYLQDDPADAMFYIENGWVKITIVIASGKEALVAIRGDGELFGMRCLVGRPRTGAAVALTACSLVRVASSTVIRLLREEPDFAVTFACRLAERSIRDQQNLVGRLTNSAEKRLAHALLRLSDRGLRPITKSVDQAVLASIVGTTRPRVSFFLNRFRRQGLIEYSRVGLLQVREAALADFLKT